MKARKKIKRLKRERRALRAQVAELEQQIAVGIATLARDQAALVRGLAEARAEAQDVDAARNILEAVRLLQGPGVLWN